MINKRKSIFPIVGIGASAGGLEALGQLLTKLPPDTGLALVVVQHLDPTHESLSAEILSRQTRMPVREIRDGMRVQRDHVYIIPPNHNLAIHHRVLALEPRTETRGQQMSIDSFFQSLAQDQKDGAIGIILSGTASDGTKGLGAIKAEGGLAIAQDPVSAKYGGMPRSAIASGAVDLVLAPHQIAAELARFARHPLLVRGRTSGKKAVPSLEAPSRLEGDSLTKILALLRNKTHVDFTHYKLTTIKRRIARRMVLQKNEKLEDYLSSLQSNPEEVRALFSDILINVTDFFRDPDVFAALKKKIFPKIMKNRQANQPLRIWTVGCATGEEAYSVAIALNEFLGDAALKTTIQIFATDISEKALQKARAGAYPESIRQNVSQDRLNRFFVKTEAGFKIAKFIRDMCLFSRHDVTSDPPFANLDLICCRNLLIYFDSALQKRVLPILHYALKPNGFLWLGRSESVGSLSALFKVTDKVKKFYTRGTSPVPIRFQFGVNRQLPEKPNSAAAKPSQETARSSDFQREAEQALVSACAPAAVLVNSNMEIILARGDTGPFLKLPPGHVSFNLFKMARQDLVPDLRMAIQAAKKKNLPVKKEEVCIRDRDRHGFASIGVIPLATGPANRERYYWVLFEQASKALQAESHGPGASRGKGKHPSNKAIELKTRRINELEQELAAARHYQQSLAEDHEATQEEITSANEELQSTNEELQSTNEELETAKEELQSTNEELTTVNDELQTRNNDLTQLNNDLVNLLGTVEFPIVMLSSDGRIRRFTPSAGKVLNLIPSDVGRPIGDIKPGFEKPDLQKLASEVMDAVTVKELEVRDREGRWFRLQARPYKTADNRIDGAVLSLIDITLLKRNLTESEAALKYATSVADTLPLPLVVLDERLRLLSANRGFAQIFELVPHKDIGSDLMSVLGGKGWKIPRLRQLLSQVITEDRELKNFEIEHDFPAMGHRIMLLNARQIRWQDAMPKAMLLLIDDITERRTLERALQYSQERFRILVESANDAIVIVDAQGGIEFANKQALKWFGYAAGELDGKPIETLIPDRFLGRHVDHRNHYNIADAGPKPMGQDLEPFAKRKDGSEFPVDISLSPIKTQTETKVTAIIRDISETKRLAIERKRLLEQEKEARADAEHAKADAQRANEAKGVFLATLSHELRTPLTSIFAWSQLLKRGQMSPEKIKRGLETIEQSARAQGQMINDLLDISRIQSGKLSMNFTEVDPVEVVRAAIESLRPMADAKRISIEMSDGAKTGKVRGDPARLQQVFWNLLTNSLKFSPERSKVEVHLAKTREHGHSCVSIRVVDHGKGIDPAFLPNLFTRFSQQDSTSTRVHGGLGIGLALVRDLVMSHSGTVKAESPGAGRGATFTVLLPLSGEGEPRPITPLKKDIDTAGSASPDLSGLKVLLLDDEPGSLEAFAEIVSSFGGEPIQCGSVRDAMIAFEKSRPDVVVSDIAMPLEDGYAFIRKIRALSPEEGGHVPAMALTAYAAHHDIAHAVAAGFQAHMAKPVDSEAFGRAIARLAKAGEPPLRRTMGN